MTAPSDDRDSSPPRPVPSVPGDERRGQRFLLETLRVDLSGSDLAGIHAHETPHLEPGPINRQISIGQLGFIASPISLLSAPLYVEFSAAEVVFTHTPERVDHPLAIDLKSGKMTVEIGYDDLDRLVLELLNRNLRSQNVTMTSVRLTLESNGPRRLCFVGRASGRKGVLSSTLEINGSLEIDDQLNARFTGLELSGPGIFGQIVAGFLQHHVRKLDDRPIPLGKALFGDLRFTDVELHTAERLRVVATIGLIATVADAATLAGETPSAG
ncbi:MAG: hypothetical protein EXS05_01775 [Planctomycetaceae bacterium]|nr:hypothetical protein [Planctomycetaceae bacterium]